MRTCTICTHPERLQIEQVLVSKVPLRKIGFGTTPSSLQRHQSHIPKALAIAAQAKAVELGSALLSDVKELLSKAQELLQKAEKTGDIRTALVGVREIGRLLELKGRATGELTPASRAETHQPLFQFLAPVNIDFGGSINPLQIAERNLTPSEPILTTIVTAEAGDEA